MTEEELHERYDITFAHRPTINSGTTEVMFDMHEVVLTEKTSGKITYTHSYGDTKEFALDNFIEKALATFEG